MTLLRIFVVAILALTIAVIDVASGWAAEAEAGDWNFWRGPEYNGISRETAIVDSWDPAGGAGSNVAWMRDDLGGLSTPVTMGGKLFTIVRANPGTAIEGERVVCVDAATGADVWEHRFNVYLSDVPDTRVGWSSCVADPETGYIYALGVCGVFQCLEADTGKLVWGMPLHEKFGLLSTYGGRTNFPIIADDLVIISAIVIGWGDMAKPAHRFIAFDKRTGDVVWFRGTRLLPYDTTYSSPTLTVLNGQQALVFGSGDGAIWALQPRTGLPIWQFPFSRRGVNVSPLVVGDRVYASHSEENTEGTSMGSVVAIDGAGRGDLTDSELWRVDEVMAGKSSPLVVGENLFIFEDGAKLSVFDTETGDRITRIALGTAMRASPLYVDGKIYALTAGGRWYVLKVDERKGATKFKSGRFPNEECYASPICSHGRIYVQTTGKLYCFADESKQSGLGDRPAPPQEDQLTDKTPAHVQVVPAEILVRPGDTQKFTVRTFNARGQLLDAEKETMEVTFEDHDGQHYARTVQAKVGDLTGTARARVVPDLPWKFTFNDIEISPRTKTGEPLVTWVGARYRHVIRDVDGEKVMVKITTIPKGARSRCWFGHPDLSNYTIQADVRGAIANGKMPDIGVTAQGYALDLKGADQKLQIRSWVPQERMASSTPYSWQPDAWYRLKLRAEVVDGKAVLKGKVWLRDAEEPASWTVEATDSSPNTSGSPGLYGNAKDAEITYDNITVTPNA